MKKWREMAKEGLMNTEKEKIEEIMNVESVWNKDGERERDDIRNNENRERIKS